MVNNPSWGVTNYITSLRLKKSIGIIHMFSNYNYNMLTSETQVWTSGWQLRVSIMWKYSTISYNYVYTCSYVRIKILILQILIGMIYIHAYLSIVYVYILQWRYTLKVPPGVYLHIYTCIQVGIHILYTPVLRISLYRSLLQRLKLNSSITLVNTVANCCLKTLHNHLAKGYNEYKT